MEVYGAKRFSVGNRLPEKMIRISVTTPPSLEVLSNGVKRLQELLQFPKLKNIIV